jgi:hypothetical protein
MVEATHHLKIATHAHFASLEQPHQENRTMTNNAYNPTAGAIIMHTPLTSTRGHSPFCCAVCAALTAQQVKQQADQQELLELQCWDAEKLGKWELERAGLAAQHAREQAAADKKVASALLEAQLVQQQELEHLTRRFQVGAHGHHVGPVCIQSRHGHPSQQLACV